MISADGTQIAYDTVGSGEPVILVGGVFSYRAWPQPGQLAQLLSRRFMVVNYDRERDRAQRVLPNGRHLVLAGQGHNVSMKAVAPVSEEFFAGE